MRTRQPVPVSPSWQLVPAHYAVPRPYYYQPPPQLVPYAPSVADIRYRLRMQLLALNREIAGWLGLDPTYTISSNVAQWVSLRTSVPYHAAKSLFHGGVAGAVAGIISVVGAPLAATIGVGALLYSWLQSFDTPYVRQ